jgi:hypothetical protein
MAHVDMAVEEISRHLEVMGLRLVDPDNYDPRPEGINWVEKIPRWWEFWRD